MSDEVDCPVCGSPHQHATERPGGDREIACGNCGDHVFDAAAVDAAGALDAVDRGRLAHALRQVASGRRIDLAYTRELTVRTRLPPAEEQLDNLLLHVAATQRPGEARSLYAYQLRATIGATDNNEVRWVFDEAQRAGWIVAPETTRPSGSGWVLEGATLSLAGWQRHAELLKSGARSRHAFMAMKFGDAELDALYRDHLRPAVGSTGFDLRTTNDDHKTAGSIDNRMRVELRTSRFVVCDLTHGNRGAYWEAGFAEGLGRPVFYTCRRDVLDSADRERRPHFDTAHQLIIAWDPADPAPAMRELKDTIRATLPAEALLDDPPPPRAAGAR